MNDRKGKELILFWVDKDEKYILQHPDTLVGVRWRRLLSKIKLRGDVV